MTAPTIGGDLSHIATDVMSWGKTDPPITIEQMLERDKVVTLDGARELLGTTEPLAYVGFETGDGIRFRVEDGWNSDLSQTGPTDVVDAFVTIGPEGAGTEYQLSLEGLEQAGKQFSYGGLLRRSPGWLVEETLNYWFRTGLNANLQLMTVGTDHVGMAFTRESVTPFSNLGLMDKAVDAILARHPGTRIFVDRNKLAHSLRLTHLQLILPDVARLIEGSGELDDRWWGGIQVTNSLVAEKQTGVEAFMFRQRCTNGYIDTLPDAGTWKRKTMGQDPAAVMAWAESSVNEALGHFDGIFDRVQELVDMPIDANSVGDTATALFDQFRIPAADRQRIINNLVETDQLTMYALTNAVTMAANGAVDHANQQRLMRTGGSVIQHAERCGSCHRIAPAGVHDH